MQLTRSEEEIMKFLWEMGSCYMKDLVEKYKEPRPAYTTVATLVSRMVEKGYIGFQQRGSVREYFPLLNKKNYFKERVGYFIHNFFNDSPAQFASLFASKASLTQEQLEELKNFIDSQMDDC